MKLAKVSTSHIQAVTGTTFVSTLSSLLFGYCTAVISGVVGAIDYNFIAPRGLHETAANLLLGTTVCAALLGTIVGALCARRAAELLGRKRPMIVAAVLFVVSAVGTGIPGNRLRTCRWYGPGRHLAVHCLSPDRRCRRGTRLGDRAHVRGRVCAQCGARAARRLSADRHRRWYCPRAVRELGHCAAG